MSEELNIKVESPLQQLAMKWINSRSEKDFAALFNRMHLQIRSYANTFSNSLTVEHIDDAVADTFSKAYEHIDKYNPQMFNFSTWIYSICKYECLARIRNKKATYSIEAILEQEIVPNSIIRRLSTDFEADEKPRWLNEEFDSSYDLVMQHIEDLPKSYKEVAFARFNDRLTYDQIAEKFALPVNTVRSRIFNVKREVRKRIKGIEAVKRDEKLKSERLKERRLANKDKVKKVYEKKESIFRCLGCKKEFVSRGGAANHKRVTNHEFEAKDPSITNKA